MIYIYNRHLITKTFINICKLVKARRKRGKNGIKRTKRQDKNQDN